MASNIRKNRITLDNFAFLSGTKNISEIIKVIANAFALLFVPIYLPNLYIGSGNLTISKYKNKFVTTIDNIAYLKVVKYNLLLYMNCITKVVNKSAKILKLIKVLKQGETLQNMLKIETTKRKKYDSKILFRENLNFFITIMLKKSEKEINTIDAMY